MPSNHHRTAATAAVAILLLPLVVHVLAILLPGAGSYVVLSGSMEPAIAAGSLVYVADTGDYQPGDVVTYTHDGRTVTHRVVVETPGGYETKGDANDDRDSYTVERSAVRGEVVFEVPHYGTVLRTAFANRFLLVAAAGGLLLLLGTRLLAASFKTDAG